MIIDLMKFVYLSHEGRISRSTYWIFSLPLLPIYYLFGYYANTINTFVFIVVMILISYTGIMISIKRCHDRNKSGFFTLILAVPIVSLWPTIELGFLKGTEGENKYGPDPLNKKIA